MPSQCLFSTGAGFRKSLQCCLWSPSDSRMISYLSVALLSLCCLASSYPVPYSYSSAVGSGRGNSFTIQGGKVTAIRVWERPGSYITSLQLCYDNIWSAKIGPEGGTLHELELFKNERIVQISGKHNSYIYELIFVTSGNRFLRVGQPSGNSFNFYASDKLAGLRMLSGRFNGLGITLLGAHWGEVPKSRWSLERR
uniref:zymogen granule membrane protein 16-like n=1 Tax=Semicossyphus pulcher TaxID=241346 RepID=UPI0037E990DD